MRPSRLFGPADRERIEAAVRAAEAETAGEIVVSVARASGEHAAAPWRLAALLAALTLLGIALVTPDLGWLATFAVQLGAVVLAHLACRVDGVRRVFVSEAECQLAAERAAFHAFTEHGIRRTAGRTGILIYVGLLEHRVVVLGDEAIDRARGPDETWEEIVSLVLDGIRAGEPTEGIVRAVARCGELLSHPLPAPPDDRDEIPHGLVLED